MFRAVSKFDLDYDGRKVKRAHMNWYFLWRGVLIVVLCGALAAPATAQSGGKIVSNGKIAGVIVGVVAAILVVAVVAFHYSRKRTVTGCVGKGEHGLTITDEKDKQLYSLSGHAAGINPGDRMRIRGKKVHGKGVDKITAWEANGVAKDFGVCKP